jgi:hypothetical protein
MQNTSPTLETGWKTYLKSAVFLAPAVLFSAVAAIFILPKLETVWRDAGLGETPELWMVHTPTVILRNGMLVFWILAGSFALFEFTLKKSWPRFRRPVLGTIVFLLNGIALYTITLMCIAAMVAAPALAKAPTKPAQVIFDSPASALHASR